MVLISLPCSHLDIAYTLDQLARIAEQ